MKARQIIQGAAITLEKMATELEAAYAELPASALHMQDFSALAQMSNDLHRMGYELVQINIALQLPEENTHA